MHSFRLVSWLSIPLVCTAQIVGLGLFSAADCDLATAAITLCCNLAQNRCCQGGAVTGNEGLGQSVGAYYLTNVGGGSGSQLIVQGYAPQGTAYDCKVFAGQRHDCFDSGIPHSLNSGKYYISQSLKDRHENVMNLDPFWCPWEIALPRLN